MAEASFAGAAPMRTHALKVPSKMEMLRPGEVKPERMREVYETVKTPHKVGMVLAPEEGEMLDNPMVFRHGGSWYMMFIRFDGKG